MSGQDYGYQKFKRVDIVQFRIRMGVLFAEPGVKGLLTGEVVGDEIGERTFAALLKALQLAVARKAPHQMQRGLTIGFDRVEQLHFVKRRR